jgi:F-type H+-transporting ATPase subunit b
MTSLLFLADAGDGGMMDMVKDTGEKFGFQWWLFLSQVLSFLIVAILLYFFAYKPILIVLEERRKRIAEGLANAEKIKVQLAEAEKRYQEILAKGDAEAQRMIDEAKASGNVLVERKQQQAIAEAEQILARAKEATMIEHDRILTELKSQMGRLVIDTATKVTGKILTPEDQNNLAQETTRQLSA